MTGLKRQHHEKTIFVTFCHSPFATVSPLQHTYEEGSGISDCSYHFLSFFIPAFLSMAREQLLFLSLY
jgi:hypothetical protein